MRVVITLPDAQMSAVDLVGDRLGLKRSDALRYLITFGLTQEQFRGASMDSARASLLVADMAAREMDMEFSVKADLSQDRDRVLVTPGQGTKSERLRNGKGRRGHD